MNPVSAGDVRMVMDQNLFMPDGVRMPEALSDIDGGYLTAAPEKIRKAMGDIKGACDERGRILKETVSAATDLPPCVAAIVSEYLICPHPTADGPIKATQVELATFVALGVMFIQWYGDPFEIGSKTVYDTPMCLGLECEVCEQRFVTAHMKCPHCGSSGTNDCLCQNTDIFDWPKENPTCELCGVPARQEGVEFVWMCDCKSCKCGTRSSVGTRCWIPLPCEGCDADNYMMESCGGVGQPDTCEHCWERFPCSQGHSYCPDCGEAAIKPIGMNMTLYPCSYRMGQLRDGDMEYEGDGAHDPDEYADPVEYKGALWARLVGIGDAYGDLNDAKTWEDDDGTIWVCVGDAPRHAAAADP